MPPRSAYEEAITLLENSTGTTSITALDPWLTQGFRGTSTTTTVFSRQPSTWDGFQYWYQTPVYVDYGTNYSYYGTTTGRETGLPLGGRTYTPIRKADERAKEFLRSMLSKDQLHQFDEAGLFWIESKGKRLYLITERWVEMVDPERLKPMLALCCHIDRGYSVYDCMLARKLAIEADEEAFLKQANINEIYEYRDTPEGQRILQGLRRRLIAEHGHAIAA